MNRLISRERALGNLNVSLLSATEIALVDNLIDACSRAVERHCGRTFSVAAFEEIYDGRAGSILQLRHFPILSIERLAHNPTEVLRIVNASADNQRAVVKVDDDGLTLIQVSSAAISIQPLAFADCPTLAELKTALDALGAGWSAQVNTGHAELASRDLRAFAGTFNARAQAVALRMHLDELGDYLLEPTKGQLRNPHGWPGGPGAYRVEYSAGFLNVPDDVQEACAEWVSALFFQCKRDPGLAQESIAGNLSRTPVQGMSASIRGLLATYRNRSL